MICAIFATDESGNFGFNNGLPWDKSKGDLSFFKKQTIGGIIVMGANTFRSLNGFLPNRRHVVLTSDEDIHAMSTTHSNLEVFYDIDQMIESIGNNFWVIGGPSLLYEIGDKLQYDVVFHTVIEGTYDGDTKLDHQRIVKYLTHVHYRGRDGKTVHKYINEYKF